MRISKHCYIIQGLYFIVPWSVNSGFIVGKNKTLIIDTGCTNFSAQTIYGYAQCARPDNQLIVLNTEKHLDHVGGNQFFRNKSIDIFGHYLIQRKDEDLSSLISYFNSLVENKNRQSAEEAAIMFSNSGIENPNISITADMEIDLGDICVKILLTPGHTNTNISVYIPSDEVIYTGDIVVNKFLPNLEEGKIADWVKWQKSLDMISDLNPQMIVPGHGKLLENKIEVTEEIARLKKIIEISIERQKPPTSEY